MVTPRARVCPAAAEETKTRVLVVRVAWVAGGAAAGARAKEG